MRIHLISALLAAPLFSSAQIVTNCCGDSARMATAALSPMTSWLVLSVILYMVILDSNTYQNNKQIHKVPSSKVDNSKISYSTRTNQVIPQYVNGNPQVKPSIGSPIVKPVTAQPVKANPSTYSAPKQPQAAGTRPTYSAPKQPQAVGPRTTYSAPTVPRMPYSAPTAHTVSETTDISLTRRPTIYTPRTTYRPPTVTITTVPRMPYSAPTAESETARSNMRGTLKRLPPISFKPEMLYPVVDSELLSDRLSSKGSTVKQLPLQPNRSVSKESVASAIKFPSTDPIALQQALQSAMVDSQLSSRTISKDSVALQSLMQTIAAEPGLQQSRTISKDSVASQLVYETIPRCPPSCSCPAHTPSAQQLDNNLDISRDDDIIKKSPSEVVDKMKQQSYRDVSLSIMKEVVEKWNTDNNSNKEKDLKYYSDVLCIENSNEIIREIIRHNKAAQSSGQQLSIYNEIFKQIINWIEQDFPNPLENAKQINNIKVLLQLIGLSSKSSSLDQLQKFDTQTNPEILAMSDLYVKLFEICTQYIKERKLGKKEQKPSALQQYANRLKGKEFDERILVPLYNLGQKIRQISSNSIKSDSVIISDKVGFNKMIKLVSRNALLDIGTIEKYSQYIYEDFDYNARIDLHNMKRHMSDDIDRNIKSALENDEFIKYAVAFYIELSALYISNKASANVKLSSYLQ